AGVLLAMREGHAVERGHCFRILGQRHRQRLRYLDVTRRRIELDDNINQVAGLDARTLADLPTEAEQELAPHAGHARPPRIALDGRPRPPKAGLPRLPPNAASGRRST